jgi:hypothetical protein
MDFIMSGEKEIYKELCRLGWLTIPYLQRKFLLSYEYSVLMLKQLDQKYELNVHRSKNSYITKVEIPVPTENKYRRLRKL